jgi:hypothetical protein
MLRTRLILTGLLGTLTVCALAPAHALATNDIWISGGEALAEGAGLNVETKASGSTVLKGSLAGTSVAIECAEEHGGGSVENSATTQMGLSSDPFHYLKCIVTKPGGKGCLVHNELILFSAHGLLTLPSEKNREELSSESGGELATVHIEGCSLSALNGSFPLGGVLAAEVNDSTSSLEFTATSGSSLLFGGNAATLTSTLEQDMQGGGAIEAKGLKGKLVFNMPEQPLKIAKGTFKEPTVEYKGWWTAGGIKVVLENEGANFNQLEVPSSCQKKVTILGSGGTCTVKLECIGPATAKSNIEVTTTSWFVSNTAQEKLECT